MARKLLGVADEAVSTFYVETDDITPRPTRWPAHRGRPCRGSARSGSAQFNLTFGAIMGKLDMFLLLAVRLALLVGGVGIVNTMLMSTTERFVEFGVMRTNGWTRRNILVLVTAESALLGLLSGVGGCVLAVGGVWGLNRFLTGFALDLRPWLIAAEPRRPVVDRHSSRASTPPGGPRDDADGRDPAQRGAEPTRAFALTRRSLCP